MNLAHGTQVIEQERQPAVDDLGETAREPVLRVAALIDGLYIRAALTAPDANPEGSALAVLSTLTKGAA